MEQIQKLEEMSPRKWRAFASGVMVTGSALTAFIITCMFIGIPKFGSLAWSSDLKIEVATQLEPVKQQVAEMKKSVEEQTAVSKILLSKVAADKLMLLMRRRCKTPDPDERVYLTDEIRRYKEDYLKATDNAYDEPTCEQIGYITNAS